MLEVNRVAILGAGAVGAFFAASFHEAERIETRLLASEPRFGRLQKDGLVVNGKRYNVPVVSPNENSFKPELVIVALKHHHLEQALPDLKNLVGDSTVILSMMNGLDSEEMIGAVYGMDKVLFATSVGIDALREGNSVHYTNPGRHYFGEASNLELSPRVRAVQAAFDRAGIQYETPPDMIRMMWWKFMVNVGMNQASAVLGAPYGLFQTSPAARKLMESLMVEVIQLAQAAGVNLAEQDIRDWYPVLDTLSPDGKTSMLQDIEAGRKTEVEIFGGKVVELGRRLGVPTPVNETILSIIQVLEKKPQGGRNTGGID
jgi:2-dehydropantoate 2-reductase